MDVATIVLFLKPHFQPTIIIWDVIIYQWFANLAIILTFCTKKQAKGFQVNLNWMMYGTSSDNDIHLETDHMTLGLKRDRDQDCQFLERLQLFLQFSNHFFYHDMLRNPILDLSIFMHNASNSQFRANILLIKHLFLLRNIKYVSSNVFQVLTLWNNNQIIINSLNCQSLK